MRNIVQIKNPKSGRYIKIDRRLGKIIAHKNSDGPYKNIEIIVPEKELRITKWK
ncbi:hypothetical protein ES703_96942 [subsurface metagenome]